MIESPLLHKKKPDKYETYCGIKLTIAKHAGTWLFVNCPECLKFKTVQAIYYDKRKDTIETSVVSAVNWDATKARKFFGDRDPARTLEEFLKD